MDASRELPPEANLKGSEAKLLLHLLRRNGELGPISELMRCSGVNDRRTFFLARKKLQGYGWWTNPTTFFQPNAETQPQEPNQLDNPTTLTTPVVAIPNHINPTTYATNDEAVVTALQHAQVLTARREPETPVLNVPQFTEEKDWHSEAMQADLMEMGEKTNQRNTPFWHRRQAQMQVLQGAWKEMFGRELTNDAAKDLLNLADDYAEEVLDAMDATKARGNIQSPLGYIRSTFRNRRKESRQQQTPSSVRPVSIDKPESADTSDDNYYRPTPPDVQRKIDKLRALGLLKEEDDD